MIASASDGMTMPGAHVASRAGLRKKNAQAAGTTFKAWLNAALKHRLLTRAEEVELAKRIESGDAAAKDELVTHNLRLAAKLIRGYHGQGLEDEDLLQEAVIGLIRAAEKFDYRRGFRFSTYATHWVKQVLSRALADKGRTIRIPVHIVDQLRRLRTAESAFMGHAGREPSTAELAERVGLPASEVDSLRAGTQQTTSLDKPASSSSDASNFGDLIADQSGTIPSPDDATAAALRSETLADALDDLSYRERRILTMRFGLEGDRRHTLDEVSLTFSITRERARLIQEDALRKLGDGGHAEALRAELEAA